MKKAVKKTAHTAYKELSIREDIRRLGVIGEATNDKVDLIAEQYEGINNKLDIHTKILDHHTEILNQHTDILDHHTEVLDQHTKILDHHTEVLNQHTDILDHHTEVLDQHTKTLEIHTEMFGKVFVDLSIIKEDIEFIKSDLKKKVDIDQFAALEKRVAFLERKAL